MTDTDMLFSETPHFTRAALREILIPEGGTDTTLAKYTFRHRGRKVERIARLDDLTDQEKAAALAFILEHGAGVRIKRKNTPPTLETLPEFEPLPDDLIDGVVEPDPVEKVLQLSETDDRPPKQSP